MEKKKKFSLSAFTIIMLLIILLALLTHVVPAAKYAGKTLIDGSGVVGATLSQTLLAPIKGFTEAIDICVFVLILGGFLRIVNTTN